MYKKTYEKPTITVVELQHQGHILSVSEGVETQRRNYGTANDGVDENEINETGEWEWN